MNRKKILQWSGAGILALLVLAALALFVTVHTDRFRRFVLQEIEDKVAANLGAHLEIQRMAIDWRPLELDFYGIVLRGRETSTQAPLFAAQHLRVGLKIISILRAKLDFREIVLDQPVARLYMDARGNSNLPRVANSDQPGATSLDATVDSLLNLAIQRLQLNSGQFFYNDEQIPMSAELSNFRAEIGFNRLVRDYRGTLAYGDGRIQVEKFQPIAHRLELAFALGREALKLDPITIAAGDSTLTAQARVTDFQNPRISGTYDANVSTAEVFRIINSKPAAAGLLRSTGNFSYHAPAPGDAFLEGVDLDGRLNGGQLRVNIGKKSITADSLQGDYRLLGSDLYVRNVEANALGGHISATYNLFQITGKSSSRLEGSIQNASLEKLNDAAPTDKLATVQLVGRVDGTVHAAWASRIQDAVAQVQVAIRNPGGAVARSNIVPVSGVIDVNYDGARQTASFGNSYLKTGTTTASVTGILSKDSRLNAKLDAADLHELAELVSVFEQGSSTPGNQAWLSQLRGSAIFQGQVLGSPSNPRVQGELSATNLEIQKTRWRALSVNLDAASTEVSLRNGTASAAPQGQITFSLNAGLQGWSFGPSNPISLQLAARDVSVADVQQFANLNYPVSGTIAANISLKGSEENPQGQGSLQIARASAWNEPLNNVAVNFSGDGNSIHSSAQVSAAAGNLTADLTYQPRTQSYDVDLKSSGIKLENLQSPQVQSLGVNGTVAVSASGHGTLGNPQLSADFEIPQLKIRDWEISDIRAQLNSANQHANFSLSSRADQASIQAKGDVALNGEYQATASLEIQAIPVAVVLAKYLPANEKVQGQGDLHAELNGPLKNPVAIAAQIEIPKLNLAFQSTSLALVRPLKLKYANGLATLDEAEFQGTGTTFKLAGTIPLKSAQPLNVSANGTIDLALLQGFAQDMRSSGRLDVNLSARGALSQPAMQGQIHVVDARLATASVPVGLDGVNGVIQVAGNRIEIAQFSGSVGGGTVAAHGFMTYGEPSSFNVGMDLKSVRLRYPDGIRSILSGNLALNGSPANSRLTGRVLVDRLSFTQQFDLANFLGQFSSESSSSSSSPLERSMKLNVAVTTTDEVNLANNKVSVEGSANLTLVGTVADPVLLGRTSLTVGDMFFMGKRYQIQNGTIEFANPNRTTPVLNLNVTTTVQQYNIGLNFVGPLNRLRTNYTSDPPLPSADIINLVAFGKTSEQAASSPSTPASVGAESVLAQGVSGQVSSKLERLTGISQLTLDPLANSNSGTPGSQVAIQQRVSGSILLTFSTDVTTTQNESIQVQYQAKKNLSISVLRDQYGG